MSRRISKVISLACLVTIWLALMAGLYALVNIDWFANLAKGNLGVPIYWPTVQVWQWYTLWGLMMLYLIPGLLGLYFLSKAFANIAAGELFNLHNSLNLRRFSVLLLVQVIAKPLHSAFSSVLLSINHPAGEKVLSISFGSQQLTTLALALILWVLSDLLVAGNKLQSENQQFV